MMPMRLSIPNHPRPRWFRVFLVGGLTLALGAGCGLPPIPACPDGGAGETYDFLDGVLASGETARLGGLAPALCGRLPSVLQAERSADRLESRRWRVYDQCGIRMTSDLTFNACKVRCQHIPQEVAW